MKSSFTLFELIVVIILIGILAFSIDISIPDNRLQLSTDLIKRYLNFTYSLALKDDKYLPFPKNNTSLEENRSKYWFRRFWQFRLSKSNNCYFFEIYNDDNLNGDASPVSEFAKDPLNNKYIAGNYSASTALKDANLCNFDITSITYRVGSSNFIDVKDKSLHIYFDNYGNVYISKNNNKSTNIFNNMKLLTSNLEINLTHNDKSKIITITPTGFVF